MSYEKQTWTTGDIITAEKLNHIENGIESGSDIFVVTFSGYPPTLSCNKTFVEIMNAIDSGKYVYAKWEANGNLLRVFSNVSPNLRVGASFIEAIEFTAVSHSFDPNVWSLYQLVIDAENNIYYENKDFTQN